MRYSSEYPKKEAEIKGTYSNKKEFCETQSNTPPYRRKLRRREVAVYLSDPFRSF